MKFIKEINWAVTAGHIIECFDSTLYGFFSVMLASSYFPASSHSASLLASYGAFAAGFFARPLGALIFGTMGDKYGRSTPLFYSVMLVSFPTIGIGLTPTFDSIGITAPVLLIFFRLLQGFLWGGEFTGVNLYNTETASSHTVGAKSGLLIAAGVYGAALATLVASLSTLSGVPNWFWRLPFIMGGLSALLISFYRSKITETEEFTKSIENKKIVSSPIKELIKNHKSSLIISALMAGLDLMPLYISSIFANRLFKEAGYSDSQCLLFNMLSMISCATFILFTGRLADRIGIKKQTKLGAFLICLLSVPIFLLLNTNQVSTLNTVLFIVGLTGAGTLINSCYMPFVASYFPVYCRYTGVALSVTTGQALLGGTAPLISSFLIDYTGWKLAPALWLSIIAAVVFLAMYKHKPDQLAYNYID